MLSYVHCVPNRHKQLKEHWYKPAAWKLWFGAKTQMDWVMPSVFGLCCMALGIAVAYLMSVAYQILIQWNFNYPSVSVVRHYQCPKENDNSSFIGNNW